LISVGSVVQVHLGPPGVSSKGDDGKRLKNFSSLTVQSDCFLFITK
jgi:hypothetical protein